MYPACQAISTLGIPVLVDKIIDKINSDEYDAHAILGGFREIGFYEEAYYVCKESLF